MSEHTNPADDPIGAVRVHPADDPTQWDARRVMFVSPRTKKPWWPIVGDPFGLAAMSHEDVQDWQPQSLVQLALVLNHPKVPIPVDLAVVLGYELGQRDADAALREHESHQDWAIEADRLEHELEDLQAKLHDWATVLVRGSDVVPAVDVASKLRQLAAPSVGSDTTVAAAGPRTWSVGDPEPPGDVQQVRAYNSQIFVRKTFWQPGVGALLHWDEVVKRMGLLTEVLPPVSSGSDTDPTAEAELTPNELADREDAAVLPAEVPTDPRERALHLRRNPRGCS